eukprot:3103949-Karenia_brevis.AAC.1
MKLAHRLNLKTIHVEFPKPTVSRCFKLHLDARADDEPRLSDGDHVYLVCEKNYSCCHLAPCQITKTPPGGLIALPALHESLPPESPGSETEASLYVTLRRPLPVHITNSIRLLADQYERD